MKRSIEQLLLSPTAAAQALDLSVSQVRVMLRRNELPFIRIGRRVKVPAAALTKWVEAQQLAKES